jgi:hypothetical protein
VQTAEWPDAADRYRNRARHARQDSLIEQDPAAGYFADLHELPRALVPRSAPTEPEVTDVTPASTASVLVSDQQRIVAGMLRQPLPRLLVK